MFGVDETCLFALRSLTLITSPISPFSSLLFSFLFPLLFLPLPSSILPPPAFPPSCLRMNRFFSHMISSAIPPRSFCYQIFPFTSSPAPDRVLTFPSRRLTFVSWRSSSRGGSNREAEWYLDLCWSFEGALLLAPQSWDLELGLTGGGNGGRRGGGERMFSLLVPPEILVCWRISKSGSLNFFGKGRGYWQYRSGRRRAGHQAVGNFL